MERSDSDKSVSKPLGKYIGVLEGCRDMALVHLSSQMDEMYSNIEPALMDFSEKAESNQLQLRFIEAIDLIKSERDVLEKKFRLQITRGFFEFIEGSPISYPSTFTKSMADGTLALMDKEELTRYRAIHNMATKFSREWHRQIYALSQRLAKVRGETKIKERDIPISPAHTASSFQIATQKFKFETQILLVVYALFEKFILKAAGTIYEDFNSRLADNGVLPDLKLEFSISGDSAREFSSSGSNLQTVNSNCDKTSPALPGAQSVPTAPVENMSAALGHELFSSIQNMLTVRRLFDNNSGIL